MKRRNIKSNIISFVVGSLIFGIIAVCAEQYIASENPFPVLLNGKKVAMEGYNIGGSTYFKLRDISSLVGNFDVDFNNNTIQLSKDGYVYETTKNDNALKEFAQGINSIRNDDVDHTYTNLKFSLADVTDDELNDLLIIGLDDERAMTQIEIYTYSNGSIEKIMNDHCGGYHGGYVWPMRYNNKTYIGAFSYSSATGFYNSLMLYKNGEWEAVHSSRTVFDYNNGGALSGYEIDDSLVSKEEYDSYNEDIDNSCMSVDDFVPKENL